MLIAQLSDTHVCAGGAPLLGRIDTTGALAAAIAHLRRLSPQPDAVLLTGDCVDRGDPAEYETLTGLLAQLPCPLYALPGNHDSRSAFRAAFADRPWMPPADGAYLHYVADLLPKAGGPGLRLIALDSLVPGQPYGAIDPPRLQWLAARLDEAPDQPTLIAMHHPPFRTGIEHMDAMNCDGGDAMADLIARHPQVVRLVCGHVHRAVSLPWGGTVASIAPSPAHAVDLDLQPGRPATLILEPPALQLLYWCPETGLIGHLSPIGAFERPPHYDQMDG